MYRDARDPEGRTSQEVRGVLNTFPPPGESLPGETMKMIELRYRSYSWPKVYQTIAREVSKGLNEVELGMSEDWGRMSHTVWTLKDGFVKDDEGREYGKDTEEVMGITGSVWATPTMALHYQDGHSEELPAYACKEV